VTGPRELSQHDYENLLAFRTSLRKFLSWSETRAREAGLTPAQYQLLVAVKGNGSPPAIGELAGYLLLRHHSTVELIDRAEDAGLVRRSGDNEDGRVIRIMLTELGEDKLRHLAPAHLDELHRLAPVLDELVADRANQPPDGDGVDADVRTRPASSSRSRNGTRI
jgi:DNA-binding MarR family transcriptional regulator